MTRLPIWLYCIVYKLVNHERDIYKFLIVETSQEIIVHNTWARARGCIARAGILVLFMSPVISRSPSKFPVVYFPVAGNSMRLFARDHPITIASYYCSCWDKQFATLCQQSSIMLKNIVNVYVATTWEENYKEGIETSFKTHLRSVLAIIVNRLCYYGLAKHHV